MKLEVGMWLSYYKYDFRLCGSRKICFQTLPNTWSWSSAERLSKHCCWVQQGQVSSGWWSDDCFIQQSGTKPNLVAKIWPPNLVTIFAWLPKLVANVSSNFHHLVNTGLTVGSFFKWLPITAAHTCKLDTIWVVYISPIGNGSIRLQSPLTHYALWNFTSSGAGHFSELPGAHT